MKFIKSSWLLFILAIFTNQVLNSQELIFLPWGENQNEIGLRKAPDGQYGPMSFTVEGNSIIILDTQNKKLKIFHNSKLIKLISLPSKYIDDFVWFSENDFYLLERNQVHHYEYQKLKNTYKTDSPQSLINELRIVNNNIQVILNESSSAQPKANNTISYSKTSGIEDSYGQQIFIEKKNWNNITVNTGNRKSFEINSINNDLGLARYLGSAPSGDIYIYLEKVLQHVPLSIKRQIYLYSCSGKIKKVINVPLHMHTYVFSEFYVDENGNLFHMITSEEGVSIFSWFLNNTESKNSQYEYPTKFLSKHHYNTIDAVFPELENVSKEIQTTIQFDTVSREESLYIGDTYVKHQWVAKSNNLTNGLILDPNGKQIETPSWVNLGVNTKVPYRWGGFNTLSEFDDGLIDGKYAGDKATSNVSSYCVGVDCSGFVSRCWKLSTHYSTRMMDDFITVAYSDWSELQPADAIHKVGHVRLFVKENPNGSLLTVEAAGADWRVSYRSFNFSQLIQYTPRYYIYMEGSPAIIPRTELAAVTFDDSVHLNWNLDNSNSIYGYNLYTNKIDDSWVLEPDNQLISTNIHFANMPLIHDTPIFYKVACVSDTNDLQEGYPTDIYGYYNSGTNKKVLIVDGFDRVDGSYNVNYHEFARTLGKSLAEYQVSFECADNNAILQSEIDINNYEAVFWILGDESTVDETFDDQEQQLVTNYLLQGGKIFISGSEIAWDLDNKGSSSDNAFIQNVLKTKYDNDDSGSYVVHGGVESIFDGLTIHFDNGTHGVYEEDYPDSYFTNDGSYEALIYENGQIAAIAYDDTLSGGSAPAKIFMMGFPFETIYAETERYNLIGKVLEFFDSESTALNVIEKDTSERHVLFDNYPNPFMSNTNIQFQLANSQFVTLEVFDLNGQKITTIVSQKLTQGKYQYKWNSAGFAEGVYFYVLKTSDGFEKTKKMVLMP